AATVASRALTLRYGVEDDGRAGARAGEPEPGATGPGAGSQSRMIAAPLAMSAAAPPISIARPSGGREDGGRSTIGVASRSPLAVSDRTRRPAGEARKTRV